MPTFTSSETSSLNHMAIIRWCHCQYLCDRHWMLDEVMGTLVPKAAFTMYKFSPGISSIWNRLSFSFGHVCLYIY